MRPESWATLVRRPEPSEPPPSYDQALAQEDPIVEEGGAGGAAGVGGGPAGLQVEDLDIDVSQTPTTDSKKKVGIP